MVKSTLHNDQQITFITAFKSAFFTLSTCSKVQAEFSQTRWMKCYVLAKWDIQPTTASISTLSSSTAYFQYSTTSITFDHKRLPQTVSVIITAVSHVSGAELAPETSVLHRGSGRDSFDRLPELKFPSAERLRRVTCVPGSSNRMGNRPWVYESRSQVGFTGVMPQPWPSKHTHTKTHTHTCNVYPNHTVRQMIGKLIRETGSITAALAVDGWTKECVCVCDGRER